MFRFIILSLRQMFHPSMKSGNQIKYNPHEIRKWKALNYGQQQRKSTTNHKIDEWVSNGQDTRGTSRRNLKSKLSWNNRSTRSNGNDDWVSNGQHPRVAYSLFNRTSKTFGDTLYSSGSSNSSNSRRRNTKIKSNNNSIDDSFSSTMYSDDGWLTEHPIATTNLISFRKSFLKSAEVQQ